MSVVKKVTKTERRVLDALYRMQMKGHLSSGRLATYERLMEETLASKAALLRTCQQLVREGKIIREKINVGDRKRWARHWPVGYAQRQAHFRLSPETVTAIEAEDNLLALAEDESSWLFAKTRAGLCRRESNGGYYISENF